MASATPHQSAGDRNARGEIRARAAAARITGRANHGPKGRSNSAIAVNRSAVSRTNGCSAVFEALSNVVLILAKGSLVRAEGDTIELGPPRGERDAADTSLIASLARNNSFRQLS